MPTLDWIGKAAVVNHHRKVPYHLLRCDQELSAGDADAGNLLVQGDNLLALKALLPYYAGKVKCIYIDPPYNTGNENWVYNDNVNSPEIRQWLEKTVGKEGEDLSRHDKWLCMMYPRMALLRDFLSDDGAIFVSIDDNEVQNLRAVMDEIFGARNFVASAVWQKRTSPDMRLSFSTGHEYVLVYARDKSSANFHSVPKTSKQAAQYKNPDDDPRGPWVSSDFTAQGFRPNQMYKITTPAGATYEPPEGVCWKNVEPVYLKLVSEGRIWFGKNGKAMPRRKTFLLESPGNTAWTWWPNDEVGHNQEAKKELDSILGESQRFDTPKPMRLLQRILSIASDKDSLILDSFAGSGTTGHAVLAQNKADGGNRRFIAVEMDEGICRDVTAQRIRKAIEGYALTPGPSPPRGEGRKTQRVEGLGGGFRFCKLGAALFDDAGNIADEVKFADLAAHVFFTETGVPIPKRPRKHASLPSPSGRGAGGEGAFSPLLGVHNGKAVYLLFNGILGDKRPAGGNVLTSATLAALPAHDGPKIVYGEGCRLGPARLRRAGVTFKQLPYDIRVT